MASGDFPWTEPPELRLWRKQADEKGESNTECPSVLERYGPEDYLEVMGAALQGNTVPWSSSSGLQVPLSSQLTAFVQTRTMH